MSSENVPSGADERSDQSLSELLSSLTSDLGTLMHQEVQLAKVEMRLEAAKAGRSVALLSAAAVLGVMTLALLAWAASWALAEVMPAGLAFVVVAVVMGALATVVGLAGRQRLQQVDPVPRVTAQTLKEDRQWLNNQIR